MKKLYTTILIIAVALFISCDEQKAKDEITKAIEKTEDETEDVADKATPKPQGSGSTPTNIKGKNAGSEEAEGETESELIDAPPPALINPALSSERAPWNTKIIFSKMPKHTYALKEEKTGVTLSEGTSNTMQVTATQSAQNVIIVTTFNGKTSESNPIEFTRIPGNTLSFAHGFTANPDITESFTQTATKSGTVAGDTRNIKYTVNPTGEGVTIDSSSGKITIARDATERNYMITAELQQNAKYKRSTAISTLTISKE